MLAEVSKIAATFGTVHEGIHWNIALQGVLLACHRRYMTRMQYHPCRCNAIYVALHSCMAGYIAFMQCILYDDTLR